MTDSLHMSSVATEKEILLYLKSQQVLSGNVDVSVKNARLAGKVYVRKGQAVAATCGKLSGNGALLTLATLRDGEILTENTTQTVESNVSLSLSLVERLLSKLPTVSPTVAFCDQEEGLQQAIHLIYQFRRTEAGSKLVEVLRSNRFYYPAWLWHSRLMTREDYIKKALAEARKWGNCDSAVLRETEKIEPQLGNSQSAVKRCIFCWSVIAPGEIRCKTCQGMLRIADDIVGESSSTELIQALQAYEGELRIHPDNSRIAYCLCLGHFSLGHIVQAREYIDRALRVSPREPIFTRAAALLTKQAAPVAKTVFVPRPAEIPVLPVSSTTKKTILVVEDSQTSRKVISMLLGRKGYTIVEAKSGSEALQRGEELIPDLVLLDVMLPDMTGYEVLSRLRQSAELAEVPVVMLTGKNKPSDRLKGLFHGSNEYLTKPFDPAKLLAVLEKYLDHPVPAQGFATAGTGKRTEAATPVIAKSPQPSVASSPAPPEQRIPATPVVFPARETLAKPAVVVPTAAPWPAAVVSESKRSKIEKTVLVVEDSPTSRKVISMVLNKRGYAIEEAPTGGAALRKMETMVPNIILLDAMLPDMTGYDILFRLKNDQRLKGVPVVMLTAKNNPVDRQKGLKGGSVAYLTKPFDPEKLLAVIDDNI
jgi:twitching motility two-component system response regulator PilG